MLKEYTKEELWNLYEKLPEELREAVFSEETARNISSISFRNDIESDKVSIFARLIGRVFLGLLPPSEFQESLKKEAVKDVYHEVNRFIFMPVKAELTALYSPTPTPEEKPQKKTAPPLKETPPSEKKPPTPEEKPTPPEEEKPAKQKKSDTYRELIE